MIRRLLSICFGKAFGDRKFPLWILFKCGITQKVFRINSHVPWPVHWTTQVKSADNIQRGDRMPGLSVGCYLDGRNGIILGENTWVGPGVKIISMNHDSTDYYSYVKAGPVEIGKDCWIAANAIILPSVRLGDHTIVAAGSVVTKSFPDKNQLIGGVPAKIIKRLSSYNNRSKIDHGV